MITPFEHQVEILNILKKNNKGKIILPTGTGKTLIQGLDLFNRISKDSNFGIYVVLSPRIMLSYQLLTEYQKVMYNNCVDVRYLCVHSGNDEKEKEDMATLRVTKGISYTEIISTTSQTNIIKQINLAKKEERPIIIFSTYHSSEKVIDGVGKRQVNTVYCDEAHYLVRNDFNVFLKKIKTDNMFFFTATEKYTDSDFGYGMNNSNDYGDVLYLMTPRVAIDKGLMLRPRLHIIRTKTKEYHLDGDLSKSFSNVVMQSFRQHSYALHTQNGKLLVVVRSISDIKRFIDSKECDSLRRSGVDVFAVSSNETIGNWVNGEFFSRGEFLNKLKKTGDDPSKRMVVLHYDILTEGIDTIFTGVLPFKSLNKTKFIQTYGRVARLDPEDIRRIKYGEINSNDLTQMYKPYGWIMIPELLFDDIDDNQRIYNLVNELRDYGFNPVDDMVISSDRGNGVGVIEGLEALTELRTSNNGGGKFFDQLEYSIEEERISNLSNEEWADEFLTN